MKFFAGLNPWMLPVAAIASFMFGGVWYSLLAKPWMAAAKLDANKGGGQPVIPMIITFVAQMFMAWMLAGLLLHLTRAGLPATPKNGMITALFLWAGFIMTSMIVNHRFQMRSWTLTLIDGGYWLGVMLIQGLILGAWGLT